jgi:hypothetical protein
LIEPNGTVHATSFRDGMTLSARSFDRGKPRESKPRSILSSLPTVEIRDDPNFEHPEKINWPGNEYVIDRVELLYSRAGVATWQQLQEMKEQKQEVDTPRAQTIRSMQLRRQREFYVIALDSADWTYRIEPGTDGAPGTLLLTPTDAAIETVRKTLTELDQAVAESAARSEEKRKELEAKDAAAKDAGTKE